MEYDEPKELEWEQQAIDGAKTKTTLGAKSDGAQSYKMGEVGHPSKPADAREWYSLKVPIATT